MAVRVAAGVSALASPDDEMSSAPVRSRICLAMLHAIGRGGVHRQQHAAFADAPFVALGFVLGDAHADQRPDEAADRAAGAEAGQRADDRARGDERPEARDRQGADAGEQAERPAQRAAGGAPVAAPSGALVEFSCANSRVLS